MDGPPHDLNVDNIWITLVRETRHVCRESANAASDPEVSMGIATEVLLDILEQDTGSSPYKQEDITSCTEALRRALNVQGQEPADDDNDDGCEVLYGQAGLLYALLRLRSSIARANSEAPMRSTLGSLTSDSSIANVVRFIIIRGRFGASHYASNVSSRSAAPALMWSWHHKRYLGAAHGVAGILHVLLMCPVDMIEPYISDILKTIEWLTTYQDDDGNWPTSLKQRYTQPNDLVQYVLIPHIYYKCSSTVFLRCRWCHGASGMLILFATLIRRAVAHPEVFLLSISFLSSLATAIQRGASLVYQKGLLCKGVGLCHGVAGSVYALLAASDAMGLWKHYEHSKVHFLRAIHLAHLATSYSQLTLAGEMTSPDKPWSLYGGVAGMCCAWAEVYDRLGTTGRNLDRLEFSWCRLRSGMPGFDDITEKE
ncbi:lanthionine synthetase C-like protein [Lentinula edodes]|nr:lanthionine synthetase C-like protein [Lentinula edodes]